MTRVSKSQRAGGSRIGFDKWNSDLLRTLNTKSILSLSLLFVLPCQSSFIRCRYKDLYSSFLPLSLREIKKDGTNLCSYMSSGNYTDSSCLSQYFSGWECGRNELHKSEQERVWQVGQLARGEQCWTIFLYFPLVEFKWYVSLLMQVIELHQCLC